MKQNPYDPPKNMTPDELRAFVRDKIDDQYRQKYDLSEQLTVMVYFEGVV